MKKNQNQKREEKELKLEQGTVSYKIADSAVLRQMLVTLGNRDWHWAHLLGGAAGPEELFLSHDLEWGKAVFSESMQR